MNTLSYLVGLNFAYVSWLVNIRGSSGYQTAFQKVYTLRRLEALWCLSTEHLVCSVTRLNSLLLQEPKKRVINLIRHFDEHMGTILQNVKNRFEQFRAKLLF